MPFNRGEAADDSCDIGHFGHGVVKARNDGRSGHELQGRVILPNAGQVLQDSCIFEFGSLFVSDGVRMLDIVKEHVGSLQRLTYGRVVHVEEAAGLYKRMQTAKLRSFQNRSGPLWTHERFASAQGNASSVANVGLVEADMTEDFLNGHALAVHEQGFGGTDSGTGSAVGAQITRNADALVVDGIDGLLRAGPEAQTAGFKPDAAFGVI